MILILLLFLIRYFSNREITQNFAKDASKADEKYAQEGFKQGQKLGEQAYEVGKDKDNSYSLL